MRYSFIVPIYNTAETLFIRCLNSLVFDSDEYEVILVNDGSTVSYVKDLCVDYVARYPAFKYYEKENGGVSSARNFGISASQGEFVIFVDSDDYISKDFLDIISEIKNVFDVCYFGCSGDLTRKANFDDGLFIKNHSDTVWGKIIRKSIIIDNNVWFNTELKFCEDVIFMHQLKQFCTAEIVLFKELYFYTKNNDSTCNKYFVDIHLALNESLKNMRKTSLPDDVIKRYAYSFLTDFIMPNFVFCKENSCGYFKKRKLMTQIMSDQYLFRNELAGYKTKGIYSKIVLIALMLRFYYTAYLLCLFRRRLKK